MKQLLRGEFRGALRVPGHTLGDVWHSWDPSSSGGSWQQLWMPAGRAGGGCFPEDGGVFLKHLQLGTGRGLSLSSGPAQHIQHSAHPWAAVGARLLSAMAPSPCAGRVGHLSPATAAVSSASAGKEMGRKGL